MKCEKCHFEIKDGWGHCPSCGSAIIGNTRTDIAPAPVDPDKTNIRQKAESTGTIAIDPAMLAQVKTYEIFNRVIENRYEIIEQIGQGGFAVVLKAKDRKLGDRTVAIKRLLRQHLQNDTAARIVDRFRRESAVIATLNHRNIVTVYDCNNDEDGDYIVMEFIEGGSLRQRIDSGRKIPLEDAVSIFRGICNGIAFAHRRNLIHRDLKPSNIMLFPDGSELVPKIVDFGLARQGEASDVSITGMVMGTPYYMSPEQQRDVKNVGSATDIYSLGKILYELLTGDFPDVVDPDKLTAFPGVSDVIFRCLKLKPEERYQNAEEIMKDLDRTLGIAASDKKIPSEKFERIEPMESSEAGSGEDEAFFDEIKGHVEALTSKNENSGLIIAEYRKYLKRFPSGKHRNDIERAINELRKQNYKGPVHGKSWKIPDTELQFSSINPGEFQMGSNPGIMGIGGEKGRKTNEGPIHKVRLTYKFWMGRYPVTIADYMRFMLSETKDPQIEWTSKNCPIEKAGKGSDVDGGFWEDPAQPAVEVSWPAAKAFTRWLTEIELNAGRIPSGGYVYRLPTEAEWEYSCRAGSSTRFYFGDDERDLANFAWFDGNSRRKTHPVGTKSPNEWGLFDMLGNVWEWCNDHYEGYKTESCINPYGPKTGTVFVRRGGSWVNDVNHCRCAYRNYWEPSVSFKYLGFRIVLAPEIGSMPAAGRM